MHRIPRIMMIAIFVGAIGVGDALAAGGGLTGGGLGASNRNQNEEDGWVVGKGGKRKKAAPEKKEEDFKKWDLPKPEPLPALDTSECDELGKKLNISPEQTQELEVLKQKILKDGERLSKREQYARKMYDIAKTKNDATVAAKEVTAAIIECKKYRPTISYRLGWRKLLTHDQRTKLAALMEKDPKPKKKAPAKAEEEDEEAKKEKPAPKPEVKREAPKEEPAKKK